MSPFRHALANAKLTIIALSFALCLSFIINIITCVGLITAPKRVRVFVPPKIPDSGVLLRQDDVSSEQVYTFTYYIWSMLNHWQTDGQKEYANNITQLRSYLTTNFYNLLMNDANQRNKGGELNSRMRTMVGLDSNAYQPQSVKVLSDGSWQVIIPMHLTETMAEKDGDVHVVKDVVMQYTFIVVRDSDAANVWGLAIDGFANEPTRISTTV